MGLGSRRGGVEGPGPAPVNLWPRPRQEWAQVRARPPRLHLQLRAFSDLSGRASGAGGVGRGRAVGSQGLSHLLARAVLAPPPPLCPSPSRVPLHPRSLPLRLRGRPLRLHRWNNSPGAAASGPASPDSASTWGFLPRSPPSASQPWPPALWAHRCPLTSSARPPATLGTLCSLLCVQLRRGHSLRALLGALPHAPVT